LETTREIGLPEGGCPVASIVKRQNRAIRVWRVSPSRCCLVGSPYGRFPSAAFLRRVSEGSAVLDEPQKFVQWSGNSRRPLFPTLDPDGHALFLRGRRSIPRSPTRAPEDIHGGVDVAQSRRQA